MIMDENGCEEFFASKESSSNTAGRPILVVGSVYCLVANMGHQIASRPQRRGYKSRAYDAISATVVGGA